MFGHGLVRLPKMAAFSEGMVTKFAGTIIPEMLLEPFGYLLTIAEFLVGLLLIIGLFTKQAAITGVMIMCILIFGSTLVENWSVINSQLIHAAFMAYLIWFMEYNYLAIDQVLAKKSTNYS